MSESDSSSQSGRPNEPVYVASAEARAKAMKFFDHAKKAAETKNYEYAIKLYVDGLALWPDAVDEGLKPLRVAGTARRLDGGKPAGFMAARRYPTNTKDVLKNLNGALFLFGMDPAGLSPLQQVLHFSSKARQIRTVAFIAPIVVDVLNSAKKQSEATYREMCQDMDAAADFAMGLSEDKISMDILQANIAAASIWAAHHEESTDAPRARSHASGKITIVKGKFDKATGFQDSLKDAEGQRELRDKERPVLPTDRLAALVARARAEWEADRDTAAKLMALVDLMTKDEDATREGDAIALLEQEYARQGHYAYKMKADDLRIKQLSRHRRELEARVKGNPKHADAQRSLAQHRTEQNNAEIEILLDRQRQYPTDMRIRYQLGVRYFNARRLDEAIPLFQQAQMDGRSRVEARLFMGRCFFEKQFYPQAVATLRTTLEETEATTGPAILELNYWLGRALQASGENEEAKKVYGHLIQLDYNYKDARTRLEALVRGA